MRNFLLSFFIIIVRLLMRLRYKIVVKGLDKLQRDKLPKPHAGLLFLPNHPAAFVDPAAVSIPIWRKFPIRPLVIDYVYYTPVIHALMRYLHALPIPDNEKSSNSVKKRRSEEALIEVIKGLEKGDNFLIYPAGRCKATDLEIIGGASGIHTILGNTDEVNVVLVRTKGLWGSIFSKAYTADTPHFFPTIGKCFWILLKNFIFFAPRREITVEYQLAPKDFPFKGSRLEINRWLEDFYNQPDGLSKKEAKLPGETLLRVPYSFWNKKDLLYPLVREERPTVSIADVPREVQKDVKFKIAELCERSPTQIRSQDQLAYDLGLDSLDIGDLVLWLESHFGVEGVPVAELDSVGKVMVIAAGLIQVEKKLEKEKKIGGWEEFRPHEAVEIAPGKSWPEVFLNICQKMKGAYACADDRVGSMSYRSMKMRVLLLAEYIRHLPGENIGVMLPASVAATLCVFAIQMAGKVPVMINWTVGPRHLESIKEVAQIHKVLTAWSFIDRLSNVDTTPIDDMLVVLEELTAKISLFDKLRAFQRSLLSTEKLMKMFKLDQLTEESCGVILFTSGTESHPKGVPLSYRNLLTNQRASVQAIDIFSDDIVLSMLPPFHSFGFNVSSTIGLLSGVRTVYVPDPTDGSMVARAVKKWGATVTAGAPTFLKNMILAATRDQLRTLRYIASGAEKTPLKLFEMVEQLNTGARLYEGYGITECSPVITSNRVGRESVGVGQPIDDVQIKIVHLETLEPLPIGENGLILVRGPNVFSGYLNKGLVSPFVEVNGLSWYNTGDLGYLTKEDYLVISGRQKRFVKIGGEMISLAAIESALLEIAPKKGWHIDTEGPSLAVCAKEHESGKPQISLFTIFPTNLEEVNNALRESGFSNLVKVTHVVRLPEIPIMGTGKINYRAIEESNG